MLLVILFLLTRNNQGIVSNQSYPSTGAADFVGSSTMMGISSKSLGGMNLSYSQPAPTNQTNRMVVQDTNMSMLVKDVAKTIGGVEAEAVASGGYMVRSSEKAIGITLDNSESRLLA